MKWRCLDCLFVGELTVHGRCARCNSNGVTNGESSKPFWIHKLERDAEEERKTIEALEALWKL